MNKSFLVTLKNISKGDYICEYVGILLSYEDAKEKERQYTVDMGSYLYFFK